MRIERFRATPALLASLFVSVFVSLIASAPASAQTSSRADDLVPRAVAARHAAVPGSAIERSARETVRLAARDAAWIATPVVVPYRSPPPDAVATDGFSMHVPGTGLDLTNGSISIRRNDARNPRGFTFSMELTY